MQSDWNSFFGDGVLDSFNMSYRDEDIILDQKSRGLEFESEPSTQEMKYNGSIAQCIAALTTHLEV